MKDSATQKIFKQNGWMILGSKGSSFVSSVVIQPYSIAKK